MKLPANLGELDWSDWILGLWSAVITGGSSAVVSAFGLMVMDPKDFNPQGEKLYMVAGQLFLWTGFLGMLNFLRQKPAPAFKTVEKTVETTTVGAKAPTVVETVKETVVAPIPAEPKP